MRRIIRSLLLAAGLALSLVPAATPAPPAMAVPLQTITFTVDSFDDDFDFDPGDNLCESNTSRRCTLRAAINEANAGPAHRLNQITLPAGTFMLRHSGSDELGGVGDLDITSDTVITGAGLTQTVIDASLLAPRDRVFDVRPGVTLTLIGLRITGGLAPSSDGGDGGGIRVFDSGVARLINVSVDRNQASSAGGGIAVRVGGTFLMLESTVDHNQASSDGGGISVVDGDLGLARSTVSRNTSGRSGGGIRYIGTAFVAENSTISSNTASESGGGLFLNLKNPASGRPELHGSFLTVANNSALSRVTLIPGGNIFVDSAPGAPRFDLSRSIVAASAQGGNCGVQRVTSSGFNLEDQHSCGFTAAGDLVNANPALLSLRIDSSTTEVHPLPPTSPAVDVIPDCTGLFDQRRVDRPKDGNRDPGALCDIGAYELVIQ